MAMCRPNRAALLALFSGALVCGASARAEQGESPLEIPQAPEKVQKRLITEMDLVRLRTLTPLTLSNGELDFDKGAVRLSPDGRQFVFQLYQADPQANRYRIAWFVASTTRGGPVVNIGDAGDVRLRTTMGRISGEISPTSDAEWSPDSRWVAYIASHDGAVQLWRSSADGNKQEQMTHGEADVREFKWSADGRSIFYTIDAVSRREKTLNRDQEAQRGYLIDDRVILAHSRMPVFRASDQDSLRVYDLERGQDRAASSQERLVFENLNAGPAVLDGEMFRAPAPNNALMRKQYQLNYPKKLARGRLFGVAAPAIFSRNGQLRRVAYADVIERSERSTYPYSTVSIADPDTKATRRCRAAECTGPITKIWWSRDGGEVYFEVFDYADSAFVQYYAWSQQYEKVRKVYSTTDELTYCTDLFDQLICIHSTPTQPRVIASLDMKTGKLATLVDPNPEFRDIALTPVERLVIKDSQYGIETYNWLIMPRDYVAGRTYPLVVVTLNPERFLRGGRGDEYPAHVFAAEGMAVLVYQRSFRNEMMRDDPAWRFSDNGIDRRQTNVVLEAAIQNLEDRGLIDRERVAVTGLSEGGSITYYALTRGSRPYAAGIVSTTEWEPMAFYLTNRDRRAMLKKALGIQFTKEGAAGGPYLTAPSLAVHKITAPLLFNLPDTEVLPASQTFVTMDEHNKPYEAYVFPNEYHTKWQPIHRYNIYRRNVQWLKFWLQDEELKDPVDPEQYMRWRKLREHHRVAGRE